MIILDEVQLCERALTSLKYFYEEEPEYHIVVAGSLLGVAVNRQQFSFPVGKVDIKTFYPMDIEEFFIAMNQQELVKRIRNCFESDSPMPSALHDLAMELYRKYLVVGGMPECVRQYKETGDYLLVRHTQDNILTSYLNDMSKYNNLNEIKKTRLVYDNITVQLSKKNTRFQYKLIKKGGLAENYVNIQLIINGYRTYYWESDRGAEIDFVIQREGKVIPIEVKSADNTRAKSLQVYMKTFRPEYAIKITEKNFGFEDGKKQVPLYATFCI